MSRKCIQSITIIYPTGSKDDPKGKEGLTHLSEHCLLKLPINGENLIQICSGYGAVVNAATSINTITIKISINSKQTKEIILSLKKFINQFCNVKNICKEAIMNEKKVISKEMIFKRKNTMRTTSILGNEKSLSNICMEDIANKFRMISKLVPEIIIKNEVENKEPIKILIEGQILKKKFCIINNKDKKYFVALSIKTDYFLRSNIATIAEELLKYLYKNSKAKLKVNYSIGYIGIYITGELNEIILSIQRLMNIEKKELIKGKQNNKYNDQHILKEIDNELLHLGNKYNNDNRTLWLDNLMYQIDNNLSCITNINNIELLTKILRSNYDVKLTTKSYDINAVFEKIGKKKIESNNEYIQLWRGKAFFENEKYISHLFWALIDGIDGWMFKNFSLEGSSFYSYKFYSREFYDFGYTVLYVYSTNNKDIGKISEWFNQIVNRIYINLDVKEMERAKRKLITQKAMSNKKNVQEHLNMAFYLSDSCDFSSYFEYEEKINSISIDKLKEYILNLLKCKTFILKK